MPKSAKHLRRAVLALYGGSDPRDLPRYSYVEAARATKVPASTIAAWVRGMSYTKPGKAAGYVWPVISRPDPSDARLSFRNLLEVHVLRALRQVHDVRLETVREAVEVAADSHGIERLLVHPQLVASGGSLFLDTYFDLVELNRTSQLAMRQVLKHSLARVEVDEQGMLFSFAPEPQATIEREAQPIILSPFISFGRAVVNRVGVSTIAIASRLNGGESERGIIEDYGLTEEEFGEAILYEAAA